MNTNDYCKIYRKKLLTAFAELFTYDWSDEYKAKVIKELVSDIKALKGYVDIDPRKLTMSQMSDLDFGKWEEERDLMLIPLWLLPFLIYYLPTTCISGSKYYHKDAIDDDHRFGVLANGVYPAKIKE